MVVGIFAPLTGVSEYMCQPGSTRASRRPSTAAPGAALGGSNVSCHLTRSFWAKAVPAANTARKTERLNHHALQFILDPLINIFARKLRRDADGVLDGIGVGTSMADNADAFDAEKRGAAVLGIVHALLKIGEGSAGKQVSHLAGDGGFERFMEHLLKEVHEALAYLERDVADEPIADDDVDGAAVKVAPFHIADEVQGQTFEQGGNGAGELVSLMLLFADGKEAHPGLFATQDDARVDLSHDGE